MFYFLNTDGGARGNPGPGALGIVIYSQEEQAVFTNSQYLGICTNNEAEYQAIIAGLAELDKYFTKPQAYKIVCRLDSELVVKQLNCLYKVKEMRLKKLWDLAKDAEKKLVERGFNITYTHVPRSKNKLADKLVNDCLDAQSKYA